MDATGWFSSGGSAVLGTVHQMEERRQKEGGWREGQSKKR